MANNLLGQQRSYCHIPWCYHAVWGESAGETSAAEPRAIAAEEIMTSVARSGGLSRGPFHVLGDSKTLTDIVSNVLRGSSAETYIHIGDEDTANLLAKISTLLPDLQLIGIDDEGKGVLINALRDNGFTVRRQNLELAGQSLEPKIASHTYRGT